MISDALQKARDFEEQYSAFILPEGRRNARSFISRRGSAG